MEISQRLRVAQPADLGQKAVQQVEDAVGSADEVGQIFPPAIARLLLPLVEPAFRPRIAVSGRQPYERQIVSALEMGAFLLKLGTALLVHKRGYRVREIACRIGGGRKSLCFDEHRPARSEPPKGRVQARGDGYEF